MHPPRRPAIFAAVAALLLIMAVEMITSVRGQSLTWDEDDHIYSGYMNWRYHDYGLNPEHPPLAKFIAALPLLPLHLKEPPRNPDRFFKSEAYLNGRELLFRNGPANGGRYAATTLTFRARLAVIVFPLTLALLTFLAGWEMFTLPAAFLALALVVFEPNLLAHGMYVTTDVPGVMPVLRRHLHLLSLGARACVATAGRRRHGLWAGARRETLRRAAAADVPRPDRGRTPRPLVVSPPRPCCRQTGEQRARCLAAEACAERRCPPLRRSPRPRPHRRYGSLEPLRLSLFHEAGRRCHAAHPCLHNAALSGLEDRRCPVFREVSPAAGELSLRPGRRAACRRLYAPPISSARSTRTVSGFISRPCC